jgi:hypothetical protein
VEASYETRIRIIVFQTSRPARARPEPDLARPYTTRPYAARWLFRAGPCRASCRIGGPSTALWLIFRARQARRRGWPDGPRPGTALSPATWRQRPRHRRRVEVDASEAPAPHGAGRHGRNSSPPRRIWTGAAGAPSLQRRKEAEPRRSASVACGGGGRRRVES